MYIRVHVADFDQNVLEQRKYLIMCKSNSTYQIYFTLNSLKNKRENVYYLFFGVTSMWPWPLTYIRIIYAECSSSYEYFILRAARLSCKFPGQGYVSKCFKSFLMKVAIYAPKCYMKSRDMIIYSNNLHWSDISLNRSLVKTVATLNVKITLNVKKNDIKG